MKQSQLLSIFSRFLFSQNKPILFHLSSPSVICAKFAPFSQPCTVHIVQFQKCPYCLSSPHLEGHSKFLDAWKFSEMPIFLEVIKIMTSNKTTNSTGSSRDGAVVRALTSHQCVLGSIPGLSIVCGLSLLLVLIPTLRDFSQGSPGFPSTQKKKKNSQIPI